MLIDTATAPASATPDEIWALWSRPATWASWDPDVTSADFDGDFVDGATGVIVPTSGPKVSFTLADVREGEAFTTVAKVPGSTVRFRHELDRSAGAITVTHAVEMDGWTTPLLGRVLGPKLAPNLAAAVANVAVASASVAAS